MRRSFDGANFREYSSSAAIESNLCGRQWGNESLSHALDLVHRAIGLSKLDTPLERDFRALKMTGVYNICVAHSNGRR